MGREKENQHRTKLEDWRKRESISQGKELPRAACYTTALCWIDRVALLNPYHLLVYLRDDTAENSAIIVESHLQCKVINIKL